MAGGPALSEAFYEQAPRCHHAYVTLGIENNHATMELGEGLLHQPYFLLNPAKGPDVPPRLHQMRSDQVKYKAVRLGKAPPGAMKPATDHGRATEPDPFAESVLNTDFLVVLLVEGQPVIFAL